MIKKITMICSLVATLLLTNCDTNDNVRVTNTTSTANKTSVSKEWETKPIASFSGNIGYTMAGNSLTKDELNCNNTKTTSIDLSIPSDTEIIKAYIFWGESGIKDTRIMLDGNEVNAIATNSLKAKNLYNFYRSYGDITDLVKNKKSGQYILSDLSFKCNNIKSTIGAASIIVVYEEKNLQENDIHVYYPKLESMGYLNKSVREKYIIPTEECGIENACYDNNINISLCIFEGDNYKKEHCVIDNLVLDENSCNGSTAPNLDIDHYTNVTLTDLNICPILFKGYLQNTKYGRAWEGLFFGCVVIQVNKVSDEGALNTCVQDEEGNKLANQEIIITNEVTGDKITITTDFEGNITEDLTKGTYTIKTSDNDGLEEDITFEIKACECLDLTCLVIKDCECEASTNTTSTIDEENEASIGGSFTSDNNEKWSYTIDFEDQGGNYMPISWTGGDSGVQVGTENQNSDSGFYNLNFKYEEKTADCNSEKTNIVLSQAPYETSGNSGHISDKRNAEITSSWNCSDKAVVSDPDNQLSIEDGAEIESGTTFNVLEDNVTSTWSIIMPDCANDIDVSNGSDDGTLRKEWLTFDLQRSCE